MYGNQYDGGNGYNNYNRETFSNLQQFNAEQQAARQQQGHINLAQAGLTGLLWAAVAKILTGNRRR